MATNPYSYGSLGQRWTVGEPTSKSLLDVSRVKADANRWALEQLIVDPDDTANFVLTAPGLNIDSNTLYVDSVYNSVGFRLTNPNDYAFNGTPSWVASGGAGNASVILVSGTTSIGYFAFADGTTGTDRYSGNIQYNHSTNTMSFNTNGGVEAMSIDSSQRVGIGTSSPSVPLHIQKSLVSDLAKFEDTGTNSNPNIQITNDARSYQLQTVGARSDNFEIWDRTAGATRLAITTAGNLGIGTTSPHGPLTVKPATNENLSIVGGSGDLRLSALNDAQSATVQLSIQADPLYIRGTGGVIKSAFLGNGNVGIGTSSPAYALDVDSGSSFNAARFAGNGGIDTFIYTDSAYWSFGDAASFGGNLWGGHKSNNDLYARTNGTTRLHINSNGDVGVGRAPYTNYRFTVQSADSSSSTFVMQIQNSLTYGLLQVRSDGQIATGTYTLSPYNNTTASAANMHVNSSGILQRSTSSAKYKTDVETIEDSYADAILNMRPVWYRSLSEADNANHGWWGFIAEEVAEIDPRLVQYRTTESVISEESGREETVTLDEPIPEGVSYDRFVPLLLNLIQRQQQSIATLETKVAALEAA